jgi:hypothetical protein
MISMSAAFNYLSQRHFGRAPLFDPEEGVTVIEPPGTGAGWWAGAMSALYDDETRRFYLYYRLRRPRSEAVPDRGFECRIATSEDGVHFETLWRATKAELHTASMEKASLLKTLEGRWRLYLSLVDPEDNRWRTDVLEADAPDGFDVNRRQKVFTAGDVGEEGVKDPYVFTVGRLYYALFSYATVVPVSPELEATRHATADIFNTGLTKSSTALATSPDGLHFTWHGDVFSPRQEGWDSYAARLGSLLWTPPVFTAFYDGSASVAENYEERTGLALTFDLRHYERVTHAGPILTSLHGSGSLRYLDALVVDGAIHYYYEYARADGSHELRLNKVEG